MRKIVDNNYNANFKEKNQKLSITPPKQKKNRVFSLSVRTCRQHLCIKILADRSPRGCSPLSTHGWSLLVQRLLLTVSAAAADAKEQNISSNTAQRCSSDGGLIARSRPQIQRQREREKKSQSARQLMNQMPRVEASSAFNFFRQWNLHQVW